ncbi:MAG: hypothetical protein Q8R97_12875, partial [Brevundimonas sp.]|nr:hypothetical protein [Brevundimonas sp.]
VAIDVDDDRLVRAVVGLLTGSRSVRRALLSGKRGKRGGTLFVLTDKSGFFRSTTIKTPESLGNIDLLGDGKMTVMEGSIHPDTGQPYVAEGTRLVDAEFDQLPRFDERLMGILTAGVSGDELLTLLDGEATHEAALVMSAKLVAAGASDDETLDFIAGLLPENYSGDTLNELPRMIADAREKGFEMGPSRREKKKEVDRIVELIRHPQIVLLREGERGFASVSTDEGTLTHSVRSASFRRWLRNLAYRTFGHTPGRTALAEAIEMIDAICIAEGAPIITRRRVGGDALIVEIDRGTPDGRVVRITSAGWATGELPTSAFVRGAGYGELPEPGRGGSIRDLQGFLGLDEHNFLLIVGFLINALKPIGPFFALLIQGEQGSGKSFVVQIIKRLLDPNEAERMRLPDAERDLMIHALHYRVLNYDNASGMKAAVSDTLCALLTGGGFATRELFSDGDLFVISTMRPVVLNGITGVVHRPDLMERAIPLRLTPMDPGTRRTEAELWAQFEALQPALLGALYDGVAAALANLANVEPPRNLRMADAAHWIAASERGMGIEEGAIIRAITTAQEDLVVERVSEDSLVLAIVDRVKAADGRQWEGTVGELLNAIRTAYENDRHLPRSPSQLSAVLKRLRPAMAMAGVHVTFLEKDRRGRRLKISVGEEWDGVPRKF